MSISLAGYQSSPYTPPSVAPVPKGDRHKIEVNITEDSILTHSEDYTPGRWRILNNGVKVFNIQIIDINDPRTLVGLLSEQQIQAAQVRMEEDFRFQEIQQRMRESAPIGAPPPRQETQFEYTPLNKISSYSSEYKGLVLAADNPSTSRRMRHIDDLFSQYKENVLSLLKAEGRPSPSDDLRFGLNQGQPTLVSVDRTGSVPIGKLSPKIANLIKDFWQTFKAINESVDIQA
jgi:hypothetical protein